MNLLVPLLPLVLAPNPAVQGASPEPAAVESNAADSDSGGRPDIIAPVLDAEDVRRINGYARGVGVGMNQGIWGEGFGQSLHLDIPFGRRLGQFFGMRLAGTFVHGQVDGRYDPVGFGHVELFSRSPVVGGVMRAYGGGGVRLGGRLDTKASGPRYGITGGGHFGLEFFAAPRVSFNVEVGVQGPVHPAGLDGGGNATAGVTIWLGDLGKRRR